MFYLASPYSHEDPEVRLSRYREVSMIAKTLIERGHVVFCPILYSHPLAVDFGMAGDWNFWQDLDKAFIDRCDEVWVVTMDGWDRSVGVQAEIEYAKATNKLVYTLHPKTLHFETLRVDHAETK